MIILMKPRKTQVWGMTTRAWLKLNITMPKSNKCLCKKITLSLNLAKKPRKTWAQLKLYASIGLGQGLLPFVYRRTQEFSFAWNMMHYAVKPAIEMMNSCQLKDNIPTLQPRTGSASVIGSKTSIEFAYWWNCNQP